MPRITADQAGGQNVCAFLDMVAQSEGTPVIPGSDDGYDVLVGATPEHPSLFSGYDDHPRIRVPIPRLGIVSTAAGRYQLLARYFDIYKAKLQLPDFSPLSQDRIAIQQIREFSALAAIQAGHLTEAIQQCSHLWASLPGAGYGQHEQKLAWLQDVFANAGGSLA